MEVAKERIRRRRRCKFNLYDDVSFEIIIVLAYLVFVIFCVCMYKKQHVNIQDVRNF